MKQRLARLLLLAGLTWLGASPARAQAPGKEFEPGIMAGVNFSDLSGADAGNPDTRTGFMAGAFVNYPAWSVVSIGAQGFYTQKGAKSVSVGFVSGTFKLAYLEFPLIVDVHTPHGHGRFGPHAFGGFYGSFIVTCQIESSQFGQRDCDSGGQNIRGTDFGFLVGLGLNVGKFSLDGRFDIGQSKIDNTGNNRDIKNHVFAISASYHLGSYK